MQYKPTRQGMIKLGECIRRSLEEQDPPWFQKDLVEALKRINVPASEWLVSRQINGLTDKPDAMFLYGISELHLCINPITEEPYTLRELFLISCNYIDPDTGYPYPEPKTTQSKNKRRS